LPSIYKVLIRSILDDQVDFFRKVL